MPSELEMQDVYGLTVTESRIYMMKLQGMKLQDIADVRNVSVQDVKNTVTRINKKIKERNHLMNIVTVNQANEGIRRKAIADMALRIIATDQQIKEFYSGTHTIVLFGVSPEIGDSDFVWNNIFNKIDPLASNEVEAKVKAEQIYKMYLELGGERGKMGYGWAIRLFNKFAVKYDMF